MYADIRNRPTRCESRIGKPCATVLLRGITEFRARENGASDCSSRNLIAKPAGTFVKAKYVRDAEQNFRRVRSFYHAMALGGVHRHRLFAEHRFTMRNRSKGVGHVQGIRRSNEHGVDFGRGTELSDRIER